MSFPAQEVLITEHLTFAPLSLVDDIINTANALLYKSVNAMEQLFSNLPAEIIPDEEVETGIHQFETLLENAVDRNFDAMELFVLRNIVNIPEDLVDFIQLRHHAGLDFSTDDSAEVEEDITKAQKTFLASQHVHAKLRHERIANSQTLARLEQHSAKLIFLEELARKHDIGSLPDSAHFLKEQINSLHALLEETTQLASAVDVNLEPTERSKYIEKVLLENVKTGTWDEEIAQAKSFGTIEAIQNATEILKAEKKS